MADFLTIAATGANIATTATSARVTIPTAQSGEVPRYVRVVATTAARVRLGNSSISAAATDLLVQPADSVTLAVPRGFTHVAAIQDTAPGTVSIVPLEDC